MDKNIEGDKYLDYSGETLEQRQNFRAVSLDTLACLNDRVLTVDKELDCRQEQGGQVCSSRLWLYTKQYMHVQCSDVFLVNFCTYPSCSWKHVGTITGRETWNSSQLASTRTEFFRLTNFRALWWELKKPEFVTIRVHLSRWIFRASTVHVHFSACSCSWHFWTFCLRSILIVILSHVSVSFVLLLDWVTWICLWLRIVVLLIVSFHPPVVLPSGSLTRESTVHFSSE